MGFNHACLPTDGKCGFGVVTRYHSNLDPGVFAMHQGFWYFGAQWIDDADHAKVIKPAEMFDQRILSRFR